MAELPHQIKPLFILGLPRSGTTLVQSLLDGHSQLIVNIGDSRFWGGFLGRSKLKTRRTKDVLARRFICHAMNPDGIYYRKFLSNIPHEKFFEEYWTFLNESERMLKDYLEAFFFALGKSTGRLSNDTLYWVEKEPGSEYYLNKMMKWWPSAKYIHVIRDPRDIYASYKARDVKNKRKITSIDGFGFWWEKSMHKLEKYNKIKLNNDYIYLRYEDIVKDLNCVLSGIVSFLGIRDEVTLHKPTKGVGTTPWGGNAVTEEKRYVVNSKAVQKWRKELTDMEVIKIENLLWKDMEKYGYNTESMKFKVRGKPYFYLKNLARELRLLCKAF